MMFNKVYFITCLPIFCLFLCSIASQLAAIQIVQQIIKDFMNFLFNDQLQHSQIYSSIISMQLSQEMQKFPFYLNTMNGMYYKIFNDEVKINPEYKHALMNIIKFSQNSESPSLTELFDQNPLWTNCWYHKNYTDYQLLSQNGKTILNKAALIAPIQAAIQYSRDIDKNDKRLLKFDYILTGFQEEGILFSTNIKSTMVKNDDLNCEKGVFNYDPRCRSWFFETKKVSSFWLSQPRLSSSEIIPFIGQEACQKMMIFNNQTNTDELHHVLCFQLKLYSIESYINYLASTTVEFLIIDPKNQNVLYDHSLNHTSLSTLKDVEFKYLKDQSQVTLFTDQINRNYRQAVFKSFKNFTLEDQKQIFNMSKVFPYKRNETNNIVILTPIFIFDKLPKYLQQKQGESAQINAQITYLQINIISDQNLNNKGNELQLFFDKLFIIVVTGLVGFGIILLIVTVIYTYYITKVFLEEPVDHLTKILIAITEESQSNTYNFILSEFNSSMFLSKETQDLYNSLQQVIQVLIYTQEHFFEDNEAETLLRLHKNIEFFKQFKNYTAIGITHNNIGNIHLNENRFIEALEHFSASIIYAKYQIEEFCKENSEHLSLNILKSYCYDDQIIPNLSNLSKQKTSIYQKNSTTLTRFTYDQKTSPILIQSQRDCERAQTIVDNLHTIEAKKLSIKSNIFENNRSSLFKRRENKVQTKDLLTEDFSLAQHYHQQQFELLISLYYRKKNYVNALIAQQENIDNQNCELEENIQPLLSHKQKSCNPQKRNFNQINSWSEIKFLLKELLVIIKSLPVINYQEVVILIQISKCHFMLHNYQKCENLLSVSKKLMKNYSFTNQGEDKISEDKNKFLNYSTQINQIAKFEPSQISINSELSPILALLPNKFSQDSTFIVNKQHKNQIKEECHSPNMQLHYKNLFQQNIELQQKHNSLGANSPISRFLSFGQHQGIQKPIYPYPKKELTFSNEIMGIKLNEQNNQEQSLDASQMINSANIDKYLQQKKKPTKKLINLKDFQQISKCITQEKENICSDNVFKQQFIPIQLSGDDLKNTNTQYDSLPCLLKKRMQLKQSSSQNGVEQLFEVQRKKCYSIEEKNKLNVIIKEYLHLQFNYTKAEYMIHQKKYIKAGVSLTNILEKNKTIISHFPYKIVSKLDEVFQNLNIQSKSLNEMKKKFYKGISFEINVIINHDSKNDFNLRQLKLLSNLINQVLNKQDDLVGIILSEMDKIQIFQYMNLMKVQKIKSNINSIMNDLVSFYQEESFSIGKSFNLNMESTSTINQTTNNESYCYPIFKDVCINETKQEDNNISLLLEQKNLEDQQKGKEKEVDCSYILQEQNEFVEEENIQKLKKKNSFTINKLSKSSSIKNKKQQNFNIFREQKYDDLKIDTNQGDQIDIQSYQVESQISIKSCYENINDEKENKIFHLTVRKAIQSLIINNKCYQYQKMIKKVLSDRLNNNNNAKDSQNTIEESESQINIDYICRSSNSNIDSQENLKYQKYIIYQSERVLVEKNKLFNHLCILLYTVNIKLLILSKQKGENFLESYEDQTFVFDTKEIIKIFYNHHKLILYLQQKRDQFSKYTYTSFIQHY